MGNGMAGNDGSGQGPTITGLSLKTVIQDPSFYSSTWISISISANGASGQTGTLEVIEESLAVKGIDNKQSQKEGAAIRRTLASQDIELLKSKLKELVIPAVPEGWVGMDGVIYTLAIEQVMNRASCTWWVEPPRGWEGLEEVRRVLASILRKYYENLRC